MLKFLGFIVTISLLASAWAVISRRLKLTFQIAAAVFALSFLIRLAALGIDERRAVELAVVASVFAGFWVLVWGATILIARRRNDRITSAPRRFGKPVDKRSGRDPRQS